jgi:hypothetical protein
MWPHSLQKYVAMFLPQLQKKVELFVARFQTSKSMTEMDDVPHSKVFSLFYLFIFFDDGKFLGDIFEAVFGAIFLDCHLNMETLTSTGLCKNYLFPFMDQHITPSRLDRNPISMLLESVSKMGCKKLQFK